MTSNRAIARENQAWIQSTRFQIVHAAVKLIFYKR